MYVSFTMLHRDPNGLNYVGVFRKDEICVFYFRFLGLFIIQKAGVGSQAG